MQLSLLKKLFGVNLDKKTEILFGKRVKKAFLLTKPSKKSSIFYK